MAIDTQKLLALPSAKKGGSIITIKTKIVKASDILKGTLAAEKKQINDQKKVEEQKKRKGKEENLETPENKETKDSKKLGIKLPKMSWMDSVKNYIFTILFGWVAVRLLDFLPQLVKLLKPLAAIAGFIMKVGELIFKALVTFVDIGYKAFDWTKGAIKKIGGEDAVKGFETLTGHLNKVMNLVIALGIAAATMGGRRPRGPNNRPKPRRRPGSIGDRARRIRRGFQTRAERMTRGVRRFGRRLRPTNIRRAVQSRVGGIGKNLTNLRQRGSNILTKAKNIKPIDTLKRFIPKGQGGPGLFGRMKSGAGNLWQGTKNIAGKGKDLAGKGWQGAKRLGGETIKSINNFAKNQLANVDNVIGGIKAQGAKWGKSIGGALDNMNPLKLGEKVKKVLQGPIDDILKKNNLVKQVLEIGKNPKKIGDILKGAAKNKNVLKLREALKVAKKAKIGGVDKVIAAIMGVIDYGLLGESPVNAILRALGGLLGYTAGFAIGAPFGGAPGFITGMAGGFVGEQAARLLSKGLVHLPTPWGKLGMMDDPIAKAIGLSPRKIVRDPDDTAMNDKLTGDQQKIAEKREKGDIVKAPEMKVLEGDEKRRAIEKLEYHKKRRDAIRTYGYGSNEVKALEAERLAQIGKNTYNNQGSGTTPINVSSVQKNNGQTIKNVSTSASYDNNGGTTVINELGDSDNTVSDSDKDSQPVGATTGGGGDSSLSESAALQYKKAG